MPQSKRMRAKKKQRRSQRGEQAGEVPPEPEGVPAGPYLKEDLDGNLIPVDYPRVDPPDAGASDTGHWRASAELAGVPWERWNRYSPSPG